MLSFLLRSTLLLGVFYACVVCLKCKYNMEFRFSQAKKGRAGRRFELVGEGHLSFDIMDPYYLFNIQSATAQAGQELLQSSRIRPGIRCRVKEDRIWA